MLLSAGAPLSSGIHRIKSGSGSCLWLVYISLFLTLTGFTYRELASHKTRCKLCTSIAMVSHQANRFRLNEWKDQADLSKPNFKATQRYAQHWTSWSSLVAALARLNDDGFTRAVYDLRNQFNHGYPRRIEFEHTGFVRRNVNSDGLVSYGLGSSPPLHVAELIPVLAAQHTAALESYNAYIELFKEQHAQTDAKESSVRDNTATLILMVIPGGLTHGLEQKMWRCFFR